MSEVVKVAYLEPSNPEWRIKSFQDCYEVFLALGMVAQLAANEGKWPVYVLPVEN